MEESKQSRCGNACVVVLATIGLLFFDYAVDSIRARSQPADGRKSDSGLRRSPRELNEQAQAEIAKFKPVEADFVAWLKANTAVTDCAFGDNHRTLFVTLKGEKYTTPENVSTIASTISRWWSAKSGIGYVNTHVYRAGREYAHGSN